MFQCHEHNWYNNDKVCPACTPVEYWVSDKTQSVFFKEPTECIQVTVKDYEELVEYKQKYEDLVKAINTLKSVSWP